MSLSTEGVLWPLQILHWLPVPKGRAHGAGRILQKKRCRRSQQNPIEQMPGAPPRAKTSRHTKTSLSGHINAGTNEAAHTVLPRWIGIVPKTNCDQIRAAEHH